MIKVKMELSGFDDLTKDFQQVPETVSLEVQAAEREGLHDLAEMLATYPPPKFGSHYHRSGDLGRGWTDNEPHIDSKGSFDFEAHIDNPVDYAGDVQGGDGDNPSQQPPFKGRWKTTSQALAEAEAETQRRVEQAVQAGLNKQFNQQQ